MKILNYLKAGVIMSALALSMLVTTTVSAKLESPEAFASAINYSRADDSSFAITITKTDDIEDYDRFAVVMLDAGKDFDTAAPSDVMYSNALYGADYVTDSDGVKELKLASYTFSAEPGKYKVKVSYTALDGTVFSKEYLVPYTGALRVDIIDAFTNTDEAGYISSWNNCKDMAFDYEMYSQDFQNNADSLGAEFVMMRDTVYGVSSTNKFASVSDIFECIKKSYAYKSLKNDSEAVAKANVSEFGIAYDDIYDISKDVTAYYKLFDNADPTTAAELKRIAALANMQNGDSSRTVNEISAAITKHAAIIGADLSYASNRNVSIDAVAAKVNADNIYSLYTDSEWFTKLVDAVLSGGGKTDVVIGGSHDSSSGSSVTYRPPSTGSPSAPPAQKPDENTNAGFKDIDEYPWAREQIMALYDRGILSGVSEDLYEPGRFVTREEMAKLICTTLGLKAGNNVEMKFADVSAGTWYYPYISLAFSAGIVSGRSETEFGVGQYVTREEMAVMILNALVYLEESIVTEQKTFTDSSEISEWATTAIDTLSTFGIINGFDDGSFKPKDGTNRAQAAVVIYRLLEII